MSEMSEIFLYFLLIIRSYNECIKEILSGEVLMSYAQGILGQYDVYATYNVESVKHASIVGLGEGHNDNNCRQVNGRYITHEAKKGPVAIFVEGYLSMKPSALPISRLKELLKIDAEVPDENIQVFGWDIDPDILETGKKNFEQELVQFTKKADELLEQRSNLDQELVTYRNDIQKIIPEFELEKFKEMGLTWLLQIKDADYEKFNELLRHYISVSAKRQTVQQECLSLPYPEPTFVKDTLPLRAEAMAKTAHSVAKLQEEGKLPALAIFIAGIAHFAPPPSDNAHLQLLKAWYDEIAHYKAAILIEKEAYQKFLGKAV
jgi:hypothetical protein